MRIVEIAYSPVKGLGLLYPSEVELTALGVAANRSFFLVDEHLQMVNGKRLGKLVQVKPELDEAENRLTLRFPEARLVSGVVELGQPIESSFLGRPRPGRLVNGPWSAALSHWAGAPLRLVAPAEGFVGVDRGVAGGVSLASLASLARLAQALNVNTIDRGRFRMLFWMDGLGPHAEDAWVGSEVAPGRAVSSRPGSRLQDPPAPRSSPCDPVAIVRRRRQTPGTYSLPWRLLRRPRRPRRNRGRSCGTRGAVAATRAHSFRARPGRANQPWPDSRHRLKRPTAQLPTSLQRVRSSIAWPSAMTLHANSSDATYLRRRCRHRVRRRLRLRIERPAHAALGRSSRLGLAFGAAGVKPSAASPIT